MTHIFLALLVGIDVGFAIAACFFCAMTSTPPPAPSSECAPTLAPTSILGGAPMIIELMGASSALATGEDDAQ